MAEATTKRPRRARGEGSIYPTADGGYRGALVYRDPLSGNTLRKSVRGKTKTAVAVKLEKLKLEIAQGGSNATDTTLAAYLTRWLETQERRGGRASTLRGRRYHVNNFIVPKIGAVKLRDLVAGHVENMLDAIQRPADGSRGVSGRTASHVRHTLRRALRDAMRDRLVTRNEAALSEPPHVERREMHVLTAAQTATLIAGTTDDPIGPAVIVAATTGLRQGELLGLRWSDVTDLDGKQPTITVSRTLARATGGGWALAEPKTDRSRRSLPLAATTVRALRRQRARQAEMRLAAGDLWRNEDDLVFTDPIGLPLRGSNVTKAFSAVLERLELPHVRFHDLRHGAASMMLAGGIPLKVVGDTLGHSTIVVTADVYAHLDREQRQEATSAIERALGGEA